MENKLFTKEEVQNVIVGAGGGSLLFGVAAYILGAKPLTLFISSLVGGLIGGFVNYMDVGITLVIPGKK